MTQHVTISSLMFQFSMKSRRVIAIARADKSHEHIIIITKTLSRLSVSLRLHNIQSLSLSYRCNMKSQSNEVIDLIVEFPKPLQQPSCTLSNTKSKKKVSFATYSLVIMPNEKLLAVYANTSTSDLWYTQSDIQSFKKEKAITIRTIRTGSTIAKLSSCDTCIFLGLESYLFDSAGHRGGPVQRRKEIRTAVLLEQIRQDNLSIHKDPAELARVSERTSSLCRQRAQIIGLIHSS